jgi:hypothetical protein
MGYVSFDSDGNIILKSAVQMQAELVDGMESVESLPLPTPSFLRKPYEQFSDYTLPERQPIDRPLIAPAPFPWEK